MKSRTDYYCFDRESDLIEFFKGRIPDEILKRQVEACRKSFKPRPGSSPEETRIQLIRKMEWTFGRYLRGIQ